MIPGLRRSTPAFAAGSCGVRSGGGAVAPASGVGLAVAASVAGTGGLYARALWPAHDIERVEVAGTEPVPDGRPVTVLLLGTDQRPGLPEARFDTVLLARIDPGAGTASLLSLPRDLMVDVPGGGTRTLSTSSDPDGMVAVVEDQIGVPVDHVVVVGFDGIRALVDRIGGVDVFVPAAIRDTSSGLDVEQLGCVTLDGEQALALVRSRRLEVMGEDGSWRHDPLSDLSRVGRQREVLLAALAGLGRGGMSPGEIEDDVSWAADHLTVDDELSVQEMVDLARALLAMGPDGVSETTIPVVPHPADENRLALDPTAAPAAVAAFLAGEQVPPALPVTPRAPGVTPVDDPFTAAVRPC